MISCSKTIPQCIVMLKVDRDKIPKRMEQVAFNN